MTTLWKLHCPHCRSLLGPSSAEADQLQCSSCLKRYERRNGVWNLLAPARSEYFAPFLRDYAQIRHAEGRGSCYPEYYRRLPDFDPSAPLSWQWSMRRRTFETFCSSLLPRIGDQLRIVDLGAGVGWMSHRLATLGHSPCAVDILDDELDGLGAARHYNPDWPRLRAEFDRLPLPDGDVDVALFNASLHYSVDYHLTLSEALRVLRPGGSIIVLDSPIYRCSEHGQQMAAERHADFELRFGTRSDSLPSLEFLTWAALDELADRLHLDWEVYKCWYGWRWALRPWVARLSGRRQPSRFVILHGQKAIEP